MTTQINKSEIFSLAHTIAKECYTGDYKVRLSAALKDAWKAVKKCGLEVKDLAKKNVKEIFNAITAHNYGSKMQSRIEWTGLAEAILSTVMENSMGFQADIAERALVDGVAISPKQQWCVAFEFLKVAQ